MRKVCLLLAFALILGGCTRYEAPTPTVIPTEATPAVIESQVEMTTDTMMETTVENRETDIADQPEEEKLRTPVKVKGIYISAYVAGTKDLMNTLIEKIDETEINAVVIDFKDDDGRITCPVTSPLLNEIGASKAYVKDMPELIGELKERGIYTIARVVTFKDPYLANEKPEWSLKTGTGEQYRDKDGLAWVDPYEPQVWEYLVEVGREAHSLGFDEIQFDYIRFATDKTMRNVVFNPELTKDRSKTQVVSEFTQYACDQLIPLGIFVSADVFGAVIGSDVDSASVGQDYADMAASLDYICPMIYPSHYGDGSFGLDYPDKHPYETILAALKGSKEELEKVETEGGRQAIVRPWLQDFTASYLKNYRKYGPEEIRAQIQAVYDAGYDEWILWSASSKYTWGGLLKEDVQ